MDRRQQFFHLDWGLRAKHLLAQHIRRIASRATICSYGRSSEAAGVDLVRVATSQWLTDVHIRMSKSATVGQRALESEYHCAIV